MRRESKKGKSCSLFLMIHSLLLKFLVLNIIINNDTTQYYLFKAIEAVLKRHNQRRKYMLTRAAKVMGAAFALSCSLGLATASDLDGVKRGGTLTVGSYQAPRHLNGAVQSG